jgi:hypothetical protein
VRVALDRALELADAAEGKAGRRSAPGGAEACLTLAMALIVAAAGPERVNSNAIEVSLTPACTKNAGTLGMPTSSV